MKRSDRIVLTARSAARLGTVAVAILAMLVAITAALVVVSGIVPVKASSGHWAVTEWLLHFSMRRSVSTHSLGVHLPDLARPALVLKGAGHYETGCRPCHASPDERQPAIPAAMTPDPPLLAPLIEEWEPSELFFIVKHGVKFTGMPAWPSQQRDDEVEAMVSFLLELPRLDGNAYRRLVFGESGDAPPAPLLPRAAQSCTRCHGLDGNGRGLGAFPKLAGQTQRYLLASLDAYADGRRPSGIMQPVARALSREEREEVASAFSRLPRSPAAPEPQESARATLRRGKRIADRGVPERGVPSCIDCHGPGTEPRRASYPVLASQYAEYLGLQLELFRDGKRGGSAFAPIMGHVATGLGQAEIRDVAEWYASLPPPAGGVVETVP